MIDSQAEGDDPSGFYWEVVWDCPSYSLDLFTLRLFENGSSGFEEIDRSPERVRIKASFQPGESLPESEVDSVIAGISNAEKTVILVSAEKKKVENWQSNWKKHFRPIEIGSRFLVMPPWAEVPSRRKKIVIHPAMGFGTGYHESTNLALCLLEWVAEKYPFKTVIDVGTGSGILAIASLLLEADHVTAIDIDQESETEVKTNLKLSGLDSSQCDVRIVDPSELKTNNPDLVVANIEDYILLNLKDDLIRLAGKQGLLLMSGILSERKQELLQQFEKAFTPIREMELNEWYAVVLKNAEAL